MKVKNTLLTLALLTSSIGLFSCSASKPQGENKVPDITIGSNGNWFIDGIDTGHSSKGDKGEKGDKGDAGSNGVSNTITIGENGNWFINGVDTGKPSKGKDGSSTTVEIGENGNWIINGEDTGHSSKGDKGEDGDISSSLTIGDNGNWFIDGVDTGKPSRGENGKTPKITIGSNGNWFIDGEDTHKKANSENLFEGFCKRNPNYEATEEEFIQDLIEGNFDKHTFFNIKISINGVLYKTDKVTKNTRYTPTKPVKTGYVFKKWVKADEPAYWGYEIKVTSDIELDAIFVKDPIVACSFLEGFFEPNIDEYNKILASQNKEPINFIYRYNNFDDLPSEGDQDIYLLESSGLRDIYKKGNIKLISEAQYNEYPSIYKDIIKDSYKVNNQYLCYPLGLYSNCLIYNKNTIDGANLDSLESIASNGYTIIDDWTDGGISTTAFMNSFGSTYKANFKNDYDVESITSTYNTLEGAKAFKALAKYAKLPLIKYDHYSHVLHDKQIYWGPQYFYMNANRENPNLNLGIAPLPKVTIDGETKRLKAPLTGDAIVLNKHTVDDKKAANIHSFLKFSFSRENLIKHNFEEFYNPEYLFNKNIFEQKDILELRVMDILINNQPFTSLYNKVKELQITPNDQTIIRDYLETYNNEIESSKIEGVYSRF